MNNLIFFIAVIVFILLFIYVLPKILSFFTMLYYLFLKQEKPLGKMSKNYKLEELKEVKSEQMVLK